MTPEDRAKIASALNLMAAVIPDTNERIGRAYNEAKVLLASADHELSALPPMPVVDIDAVIREVAELPDRTTPIDLYNDHMIVSGNELRSILRAHVIDVSGERAGISPAQIKHMVERFLNWRLPSPWYPDGGISFERYGNKGTPHEYDRAPLVSGTNLFDFDQATAMVKHMLEGLPPAPDAPGERAPIDGLETTAEERSVLPRHWHTNKTQGFSLGWRDSFEQRLLRDIDRLTAAWAAAGTAAKRRQDEIDRLTALLAEAREEVERLKRWHEERSVLMEQSIGRELVARTELAESRAREARARKEEQEACAKIADESTAEAERLMGKGDSLGRDDLARISRSSWRNTAQGLAAAIRARGEA